MSKPWPVATIDELCVSAAVRFAAEDAEAEVQRLLDEGRVHVPGRTTVHVQSRRGHDDD